MHRGDREPKHDATRDRAGSGRAGAAGDQESGRAAHNRQREGGPGRRPVETGCDTRVIPEHRDEVSAPDRHATGKRRQEEPRVPLDILYNGHPSEEPGGGSGSCHAQHGGESDQHQTLLIPGSVYGAHSATSRTLATSRSSLSTTDYRHGLLNPEIESVEALRMSISGAFRQPHVPAACSEPQHNSCSDGSQQVAWVSLEQQLCASSAMRIAP